MAALKIGKATGPRPLSAADSRFTHNETQELLRRT